MSGVAACRAMSVFPGKHCPQLRHQTVGNGADRQGISQTNPAKVSQG